MPFERIWDESCPHVYDQWEVDGTRYTIQDLPPEDDGKAAEILLEHLVPDEVLCCVFSQGADGTRYTIQDLPPEDDGKAAEILLEHLVPGEMLCQLSGITEDPESVEGGREMWMSCCAQRMSLACYAEKNNTRELVAVNTCYVKEKGEDSFEEIKGKSMKNVIDACIHSESRANSLEHLGLDKALGAIGLVVVREYRGAKLGSRVLAAREPLCRAHGIGGTTSIFTGIAAQKSAARVGFHTIYENPIKEYAQAGLDYPADDERIMKIMVKKYE